MNAEKIALALQSTRDYAGIHKLILAVDPRRQAIRARIAEIAIANSVHTPIPAERKAAIAKGPEAVSKLEKEIESLSAEEDYLAQLERELFAEWSAAEVREIAAAIPGCLRRLPGAIRSARDALKKLDEAIAVLRTITDPISNFEKAGVPFPLSDAECAELLQLRADVWQPRHVPGLHPPGAGIENREGFPLSFPLLFRERSPGVFSSQHGPTFLDSLDFTNGETANLGRRSY